MSDVIILGSGPAGISAALYTARANLKTLILSHRGSALKKAGRIENYYGFREPVSGEDLLQNGLFQAERIGARFVWGEAVGASWDGKEFTVLMESGKYQAPFLILATGLTRQTPRIPGISEFEGRGVSYCAVCDAFFFRGKPVAVLGGGAYALHEAETLCPLVSKVTVLTDGAEPSVPFPENLEVRTEKIIRLLGDRTLRGILLENGDKLETAGLFVALGTAGGTDLARKLGAETRENAVVTDSDRRTSIPGLYAAGDCTGGLAQISKAVADGALAGTAVVRAFRSAPAGTGAGKE